MRRLALLVTAVALSLFRISTVPTGALAARAESTPVKAQADVLICGATPCGISAAIAAARGGCSVILVDRNAHIGGLMANGLGATDLKTRGAIGGIFLEYVHAVRGYYAKEYGEGSPQVTACNDGYFFEPHVAETLFTRMLAAEPGITVVKNAELVGVDKHGRNIRLARFKDRESGETVAFGASRFVDATYEGDLAAMAGVPFRVGRESRKEHGEPYAGVVYWDYRNKTYYEDLSTGEGDNRIQAYNYRLCMTRTPENRVMVEKPAQYNPDEYRIITRQVRLGKLKSFEDVVNPVAMPNGKTDTNNHTIPLLSTDLPVENYPYPTASWQWRDSFAERLRSYTLGLIYFCQHDLSLPEWFLKDAGQWGLAKDEYTDNGNFPRQIYVREARRIDGDYSFTAQDVLVRPGETRPHVQEASVACGSYEIDSHPTRKYEPGVPVLEGLLGLWDFSWVYQVPYGVMLPQKVDNLLVPCAVSSTHMGFSTIRMEPCWMALGQAAGTAANLSLKQNIQPRKVDLESLQRRLLADKAVLMYFQDVTADSPNAAAIQFFGSRGAFNTYETRETRAVDRATAALWIDQARRMGYWSKGRQGPAQDFVDVPADHPSRAAIRALNERGIFKGEPWPEEFRPNEALTPVALERWFANAGIKAGLSAFQGKPHIRRGELLSILYRLGDNPKS